MSRTRYMAFLAAWMLLLPLHLAAQRIAVAKNVDITISQNTAFIHYDIRSRKTEMQHRVDLKFLDENYNLVNPSLLSGDIGANIPAGKGRIIEWDINHDIQSLESDVTPVLFVDGISSQYSNTGGPRNAMLSLIMPGLGDYFVADTRLMKFKPYMRTLSSLGLIGLGVYLGNQRYRAEGEYRLVLKADEWRYTGMDKFWERYFEGDIQYAWFKGDQEVFIAMGAAIWAADVIWVLAKGTNNVRFLKSTTRESQFHLGYIPGGAALQFNYTF
jgi:hypothetical protein